MSRCTAKVHSSGSAARFVGMRQCSKEALRDEQFCHTHLPANVEARQRQAMDRYAQNVTTSQFHENERVIQRLLMVYRRLDEQEQHELVMEHLGMLPESTFATGLQELLRDLAGRRAP